MPDNQTFKFVPRNPVQIAEDIKLLRRKSPNGADAWKEGAIQQYTQDQQNAFNVAMWNAENEYNRPINQMARYQDAGLNPNLIYGQSNTSASAPTSASGQSWNFAGSTRNKISKFQATASALMETAQFANQLHRNISEIKYRDAMTHYMKQKEYNEQMEFDKNYQSALQQKLRTTAMAYRILGPKGFNNYLSFINNGVGVLDRVNEDGVIVGSKIFDDVLDSIGYSMEKSGLGKSNATIANLLSSATLHDAQTSYTQEGEELRRQEKEYQDVKKGAVTRLLNGDISIEDLLRIGLISALGL